MISLILLLFMGIFHYRLYYLLYYSHQFHRCSIHIFFYPSHPIIQISFAIILNLENDLLLFDSKAELSNTILSVHFSLCLDLSFFAFLKVNYNDFLKHFLFSLQINILLKTIFFHLCFIWRFQVVLYLHLMPKDLFLF